LAVPAKSYRNLNNKNFCRKYAVKPTAKKQQQIIVYNGLCSEIIIFCCSFR